MVMISAKAFDGTKIIEPVGMISPDSAPTSISDVTDPKYGRPMEVQGPAFITKKVKQSSPYPGLYNTLTVSFSANMDLKVGSIIAFSGFVGASAEPGDMDLSGADRKKFTSLTGTAKSGTWSSKLGCEPTLLLKVATALGCNGKEYTISFGVKNPVNPQPCAAVRVNATMIAVHASLGRVEGSTASITIHNAVPSDSLWAGVPMVHDVSERPADTFSAIKSDACPMKVWPGAFIITDIGQSSEYPLATNTITITMTTNVPIPAEIRYWDTVTPIWPTITISRLQGAVNDMPLKADGKKDITVDTSYYIDHDEEDSEDKEDKHNRRKGGKGDKKDEDEDHKYRQISKAFLATWSMGGNGEVEIAFSVKAFMPPDFDKKDNDEGTTGRRDDGDTDRGLWDCCLPKGGTRQSSVATNDKAR
jgi:hypothetical protein